MRKTLSILSIALVIILGTSSAVLERHYGRESPTAPDPASGRVNALNVHGRIVYLSDYEMHLKTGVLYGTLLFVVLGGWLWATGRTTSSDTSK